MNNKNVVYSELIRKLNAIHIVSECLSNTERGVHESKKIMNNRLREANLFVPAWELRLTRTYGTKGFHVVGNEYHGDYMLMNMNLSGMDLSGIDFSHVHFQDCDLSYCNLSNTNFDGAYLDSTNITGAKLNNANFSNVYYGGVKDYPLKLNAYGANLDNSYFSYVNMSNSNFTYASLRNTYLSGCILHNVKLTHADLTNVCLSYSELCDSDLYDTVLDSASLFKATIRGFTDLDKARSTRDICIDMIDIDTSILSSMKGLVSVAMIILLVLLATIISFC